MQSIKFGSFLIDDAETIKKGGVAVLFKGGSALQYLSHIVTIICLRWPENENYKDMFQYLQKKNLVVHLDLVVFEPIYKKKFNEDALIKENNLQNLLSYRQKFALQIVQHFAKRKYKRCVH